MIELNKMTEDEFRMIMNISAGSHINELMKEEGLSYEDAVKETENELAEMLPDGIDTKDNYLMTIKRTSDNKTVGFIWTLHEYNEDVKQSFICDFLIYETYRRQGYGTEALFSAEKYAKENGCAESVLFVNESNIPAVMLYEKCGYTELRKHTYGKYMKKAL